MDKIARSLIQIKKVSLPLFRWLWNFLCDIHYAKHNNLTVDSGKFVVAMLLRMVPIINESECQLQKNLQHLATAYNYPYLLCENCNRCVCPYFHAATLIKRTDLHKRLICSGSILCITLNSLIILY